MKISPGWHWKELQLMTRHVRYKHLLISIAFQLINFPHSENMGWQTYLILIISLTYIYNIDTVFALVAKGFIPEFSNLLLRFSRKQNNNMWKIRNFIVEITFLHSVHYFEKESCNKYLYHTHVPLYETEALE